MSRDPHPNATNATDPRSSNRTAGDGDGLSVGQNGREWATGRAVVDRGTRRIRPSMTPARLRSPAITLSPPVPRSHGTDCIPIAPTVRCGFVQPRLSAGSCVATADRRLFVGVRDRGRVER